MPSSPGAQGRGEAPHHLHHPHHQDEEASGGGGGDGGVIEPTPEPESEGHRAADRDSWAREAVMEEREERRAIREADGIEAGGPTGGPAEDAE
jgi:hypothetical protein